MVLVSAPAPRPYTKNAVAFFAPAPALAAGIAPAELARCLLSLAEQDVCRGIHSSRIFWVLFLRNGLIAIE